MCCPREGREFSHFVVDGYSVQLKNRNEKVEHIHRDTISASAIITLSLGAKLKIVLKQTNTAMETARFPLGITNRAASLYSPGSVRRCKHLLNSGVQHGARMTAYSRYLL